MNSHADTNIPPTETGESRIDSEMEDFDLQKDEWKFTAFHFYVRPLEGESAKDNAAFEAEREQILNNLKMIIASQTDSAEALADVAFDQAANEFKEFTAQNPNILTEFGVSYANAYDKPDSPSGNITLVQSKNGKITYNNEYGIDESLFTTGYAVDILKENLEAVAAKKQEQELSDPLKRAMSLINEYCEAEFEGEADFSDLSKVDLAYTTDAETEVPIQVYADLENFRLVKEYDGKIASEEKFDSLDDLSDKVLSNLEFDELVAFYFAVPAEQQIGQEQAEKPENTQALYSIEQGDDIRHYKAAEEYSINDILNAANSSSPFLKLMDMGKQISIDKYAEIQQSDRFSFSVEMNFDTLSGTIYEVNGGKGGIAEEDRTDDNIRFISGKLSELRGKIADLTAQRGERKQDKMYDSIFDKVQSIDVTIGEESVRCTISADHDTLRHSMNRAPNIDTLGEHRFDAGGSRYSNESCDFALVYVEIPDEDGDLETIELYAECDPEDVPGEGHFENGDGICNRDDEGAEWVFDDDSASEKFLLLALEKLAEEVADERGIETPFHAPQIPEKEESNPLLDSLYEKVNGEYKAFITDMQKQDTATAIESAYEIVWKDNITQFLENENPDLTEAQCNALLSSKNTLDEIYARFLKMDGMSSYEDIDFVLKDNADRIISAAEREREAHMTAPLILHDGQTARSLGENGLNDFRSSLRENRACAEAIIAAKKENTTYGEMAGVCFFDAAKTVDDVLAKGFPPERLGFVIASQVVRDQRDLDNPRFIDGRFSRAVKEWAIKLFSQQENFPFRNFEDCNLTSAMHHTLINSLAEKFIGKQAELSKAEKTNDESEKKPSVLGKIQKIKSEQKAREAAAPQKKERSKSNDQEL